MDYEFTLDEYDRPSALFSSGFEALGRWFTEELSNHEMINELLDIVEQLEQHRIQRRQLFGRDSHLDIDQDEVTVTASALDSDIQEEIPEGTRLYDDEANASCGLQDFKQALLGWQAFVV